MKKIRTIKAAVDEIHELDPRSCITENFVRRIVIDKRISSIKAGKKYLVDMEELNVYLSGNGGQGYGCEEK